MKRPVAEIWMGWVRLLAVLFAALEVGVVNVPEGHETWAWTLVTGFAVGSLVLLWLAYRASRTAWSPRPTTVIAMTTQARIVRQGWAADPWPRR